MTTNPSSVLERLRDRAAKLDADDLVFFADEIADDYLEAAATIERLSAQLEQANRPAMENHMAEWQPIETAPDGELVLLYEDGAMRLAFKADDGHWEQPAVPIWRGEFGDGLSSNDLRQAYGIKGELALSDCLYEPTHWMPLPEPPVLSVLPVIGGQ